ncbi:hypothetical protein [Paraburkholderia sp.]|uniref:hypothetical protein n=1 Tax=Paraburkholderia sp. TaxID=1926495 RepID=UPI003D700128
MRGGIIMKLMRNLELRIDEFESAYGVRFAQKFAPEIERLQRFERNGVARVGRYVEGHDARHFSRTV